MRMSTQTVQRLGGLSAVNPDSVTGTVVINGQSIFYRRGLLTYNGQPLKISDDHDLVIDYRNRVFGSVVNGKLTPLKDLTPSQLSAVKAKYKL
jgi:hypothetical protein